MMQIVMLVRRMCVWVGEIISEAILIAVFLTSLWCRLRDSESLGDMLKLWFFWPLFLFMVASDYLLTTGFFGIVWRSSIQWVYPLISALLFVVHIQIFPNGWDLETRIPVQVGGASIVFACCYGGNWFLKRWSPAPLTRGSS